MLEKHRPKKSVSFFVVVVFLLKKESDDLFLSFSMYAEYQDRSLIV